MMLGTFEQWANPLKVRRLVLMTMSSSREQLRCDWALCQRMEHRCAEVNASEKAGKGRRRAAERARARDVAECYINEDDNLVFEGEWLCGVSGVAARRQRSWRGFASFVGRGVHLCQAGHACSGITSERVNCLLSGHWSQWCRSDPAGCGCVRSGWRDSGLACDWFIPSLACLPYCSSQAQCILVEAWQRWALSCSYPHRKRCTAVRALCCA